jgi:hypothetical protein
MKKVFFLMLTVVLFMSCENKTNTHTNWNDIGKWDKGRFVVNDQISFENKEIVFAQNDAKDSTVAYIRYDLSVNDEIVYQAYFIHTTSKKEIVSVIQLEYENLCKNPDLKKEIIKQYPIKEEPVYKSM